MALCKLSHWGFDEGLIGVSDTFAVIISKQVAQSHNAPGVLLNLTGRDILGPQDRALWPHQVHLKWHRNAFRLQWIGCWMHENATRGSSEFRVFLAGPSGFLDGILFSVLQ